MKAELCWVIDDQCLDVQTWKGKGIFDNMRKTFNSFSKRQSRPFMSSPKRFDSQNEFDPDEGWRNRDREGVVGANLSWQPCDFHSDWLFKARLEAWRIFTSFPAKKSIHMIIVETNVLNQLRVMVVGLGGWRVGDLREMAATLRVRRSLL